MLYPDFNDLISFQKRKMDKLLLSRKKVSSRASGSHHSPFRGQGLDFDGVREYVIGDDIRNIDWRVTARTGSPHIKLFKEEKERHTLLCLDMNESMRFGTRNTFKSIQAARCLSFLSWRSLAHHDRLSVCLFGDVPGGIQYFSPLRTRQALLMMLKTLTKPPEERHKVPIKTALEHVSRAAYPGSQVYVISDFMDLSFSLMSRNLVFISINDPADQFLTAAGVIGFSGQNQDKLYFNTDNRKGREAYKAQWEDNRRALKSFNTPLIELSTESDIYPNLLLEIKNLRKRCLH